MCNQHVCILYNLLKRDKLAFSRDNYSHINGVSSSTIIKKLFLCSMKHLKNLILILTGVFILSSCQKEISLETGVPFGAKLTGSIKDTLGNCLPIIVRGVYKADSTLRDSNYVQIQLNVTAPGFYKISSDTLNGYSFKDSGFFSSTGLKTLKLKGNGKPIFPQQSIFTIAFGGAFCSFTVDATGSGGGGTTPVLSGDYFPTSTGSNWTYTFNLSGDTIRFTADASNTTLAGNTYRNFIALTEDSRDTLLYRKSAGLYYEYGNIDFLGVLDTVYNSIEFIFLKDNVPVAGTWESGEVSAEANNMTGTAKLRLTITEKNVTKTIGGVQVDSVIVVKREIMFKPTNGSYTVFSTMFVNYAKNKGLLLIEGTLPPPLPALPYRFEATRHQIR
jgi:hypothetical protein